MTDARKRIVGWMMFDWASQPFYTLLLTFVFGPYFAAIATNAFMSGGLAETVADARAQSMWSLGQTVTGLLIAFTAPILGAFADTTGRRMRYIYAFSVLYVLGTAALWWTYPDGSTIWIALLAFGIGMVGAEFALVFVNALLPSLGGSATDDSDIGRISGSGYALGYAGGVVSLFIMLLLFAESEGGTTLIGIAPLFGFDPAMREGTRFVGPFTAIWFMVFMIPFFLWVRDDSPPAPGGSFSKAMQELGASLRSVLRRRSLASYLASSMLYRDALNALYGFGGVYATLVLDWSITMVGIFGIIGAITAAIFTWIGGRADGRYGPKPVILFTVWVLIAVCIVIVGMSRADFFGVPLAEGSALPDITFYILGAAIGAAGGALQAASRTMMVRHTDPARPTEAFGLYALSGKATAFLAPAMIGIVTYLSESARIGLSPVIVLFIIALFLLRWVHPNGERDATWHANSPSLA
ncbi:MFS transporter [Anianabacter salinae]|uniref:MFS transporter n=1 Tax=Anianabacter salinae TaxID=2851023 RepID=UPI00225DF270|nr:MFS transporter [Anianabacter salinae]MBV0913412.1 MFS transporter [Anianabacter salinae]